MADLELGAAYFQLVPSLKGAKGTIAEELTGDIVPEAEKAGKEGGEAAGASMSDSIKTLLAAAAIGAVLSEAWTNGFDEQKGLNKIKGALGLTEAQSETAGNVAGSLYADAYGESITDVTDAVGSVMSSISGMGTASEADLQKVTAAAMDLSSAFGLDVSEVAASAGQMIKTGLAGNGIEAMDLLTASLQKVPEAMRGDVIDAANEYGGVMKDLGFSGSESFGLLVEASAGGTIAIDKTGDALKEFSIRATDMSTTSVDAYNKLGLNAEDMSNRILAGGDTARGAFGEIVGALQGIEDPAERANTAIALFGTPIEDLGVAQIPAFLDSLTNMNGTLGDVGGAAGNLGDTLANGVNGFESLKRSVLGVITEALVPLMGPANAIAEWLSANPALVQGIVTALGIFAGVLAVITAAQWLWNAAMAANPMTWIVLGIAALIAGLVLLITNWDAVVAWLTDVWGACVEWLKGAWDAVVNAFNTGNQAIANFFINIWNSITTFLTDTWNRIVQANNTIWTTVKNFIVNTWNTVKTSVSNFVQGIHDTIVNVWNRIKAANDTIWNAVKTVITNIWNSIKGFIQGAIDGVKTTVTNGLNAVKDTNSRIWGMVVDFVKGIPQKILSGLQALANLHVKAAEWFLGFLNAAKEKLGQAVDFVKGIPGKIVSAMGNLGSKLINSGSSLIQGFIDGINRGFSRAVSAVQDGMQRIRDFFPFSPAKEGPFSGSGWTFYSGQAIMGDLEEGIKKEAPSLSASANLALTGLRQAVDVSGMNDARAMVPAGAGNLLQQVTVNIPPEALQDVETFLTWLRDLALEAHQMKGA